MTNEAIEVIHFRLSQLYKKWSAIIDSERCPAVLGLLGLSEAECDEISDLVKSATEIFPQNYRIKPLRKLLDQHPAVIAMWLARKAGEAYDLGAFWDLCSAKNQKPVRDCDVTMSHRP